MSSTMRRRSVVMRDSFARENRKLQRSGGHALAVGAFSEWVGGGRRGLNHGELPRSGLVQDRLCPASDYVPLGSVEPICRTSIRNVWDIAILIARFVRGQTSWS